MNKRLYAAIGIAVIVTTQACLSLRKKPDFEFPEAMLPHVKVEYTKQCEKGKILYDMNCAGCHNIGKGKKAVIPDFSSEQLKGYELRISNERHESSMPDSLVSAEELGIIMTFLMYKKKSGVEFVAGR